MVESRRFTRKYIMAGIAGVITYSVTGADLNRFSAVYEEFRTEVSPAEVPASPNIYGQNCSNTWYARLQDSR